MNSWTECVGPSGLDWDQIGLFHTVKRMIWKSTAGAACQFWVARRPTSRVDVPLNGGGVLTRAEWEFEIGFTLIAHNFDTAFT